MIRLVGVAIVTLLAAAACAGSSDVAGERRNVGNVTVTFTVNPARAKVGQTVRLTIRLLNNSGRAASLTFPSAQKYDFWITEGGREIWRWSAERVFTQDVTQQDLDGQTGTSFSESWRAAQMGKLVAHGRLTAETYDGEMTGAFEVG